MGRQRRRGRRVQAHTAPPMEAARGAAVGVKEETGEVGEVEVAGVGEVVTVLLVMAVWLIVSPPFDVY